MDIEFTSRGAVKVTCEECGRKVNESFVLELYAGSLFELCAECMETVADEMKAFMRRPRA